MGKPIKPNTTAAKQATIKKAQTKREYLLTEAPFEILSWDMKRIRVLREQKGCCSRCGINEWLENPISLEVDHKDGNRENNSRDNLEGLCPNCHSMTDTWRGRNKSCSNFRNQKKVSDDELIAAIRTTKNARQALLKVGLAAKGANYQRVYLLETKLGS